MGRLKSGLGACAFLALLVAGCQNPVAEENRKLHSQNVELQTQLDDAHRRQTQTPPPAPAPVVVTQAPVAPPAPAPATAPSGPADLGSLQVTQDVAAGTTTVSLPGDVFFDPGKDAVKESAKPTLDKVVAALKKQYAGKPVRVEGYTDTDPIKHSHWQSNQQLSEARAKAVRDYLATHGISASRLSIMGLGDAKPKATKALSRRVEVVVVTG